MNEEDPRGALDRIWSWETNHPIRAYLVIAAALFTVMFAIGFFAFGMSVLGTLTFAFPLAFFAPILRFVTVAGWRGAPRPRKWGKDRRYYRGPLR